MNFWFLKLVMNFPFDIFKMDLFIYIWKLGAKLPMKITKPYIWNWN
jgi:hypothetical protein